jgi:formate hydrogenlyase subunit 6/NADH:ubiquinone oxidoreductase subunit I
MVNDDYIQLAKILKTPTRFIESLPLIVKPTEIQFFLKLSEKELSIAELFKSTNVPKNELKRNIKDLYRRGFLNKKLENKTVYSIRSFSQIIASHLAEGRDGELEEYRAFLNEYRMKEIVKQAKNHLTPRAKVYPIPESLSTISISQKISLPKSVIISQETVINILEKAKSISLRNCVCRMTYRNCDNPMKTCITVNELSVLLIDRGIAKEISLHEMKEVVKIADKFGLIHMVIYSDWLKGEINDICSCCSCCCTPLRAFLNFGVSHHLEKSGLIAKMNNTRCNGCGRCIERCKVQARYLKDGKSVTIEETCIGCGLCVTTCPREAITLSTGSILTH